MTEKGKNSMLTDIPTKIYRGEGFMTIVTYNNKGDLIYIGDKNSKTIYSVNVKDNKIVGAFHGHNGTVWHLAISQDDSILVSCGADMSLCYFNTSNGELIFKDSNTSGIPKHVDIIENKIVVFFDALGKKYKSYITVYDLDTLNSTGINKIKEFECDNSNKPCVTKWFDSNKIIIGYENGSIIIKHLFDESVQDIINNFHTGPVKSLVFNNAKTMILTGSHDSTSKLIKINETNSNELEVVYTCESTCPINSAIFSYNEKKIILAGGIDAIDVAMSGTNDLTIKFFDIKQKKLISKMASHFGPVRCIARAPKSKNFTSASQDGMVKIYNFDEKPIEFENYSEPTPFGLSSNFSKVLTDENNKMDYVNVRPPLNSSNNTSNTTIAKHDDKPIVFADDRYKNRERERVNLNSNDEINKTTIRISGLSSEIEHHEVKDLFEFHGKIQEEGGVKVIYKHYDTYAFVKYVHEESAQKAINARNNKPFGHTIIKVELAESR
jgi:WD40 repeat protein